MNPLHELDAIAAFLQPFAPTAAVHLLNLPEVPEDNMLVLRFLSEEQRQLNGFSSENIRRWQVFYFNKRINEVVETSHKLGQALIHGITIPFEDEEDQMWYVRVQAFQTGQPNQADSGFDYTLSILETTTKGIRSIEQFETMQEYIKDLVIPDKMSDLTYNHIEGQELRKLDALDLGE